MALTLASCASEKAETLSPDAKTSIHEELREDLERVRHASDGGGRAFLDEEQRAPVMVGSRHRFEIVYEAGPHGIAEGGTLFLLPSPFWGWDPPQIRISDAPGYTEVETDAPGVELKTTAPGDDLLAIAIRGRALAEGERVRIVYGAGPAGARVDRYAESRAPIWLAVDGDGDGVRSLIKNVPAVDVAAGPAALLVLTLPSTARPGDRVRLTIAILDGLGNAGVDFEGRVELVGPSTLELPGELALSDRGVGDLDFMVGEPGVYRVMGAAGEMVSESNPLVVREGIPRILWGESSRALTAFGRHGNAGRLLLVCPRRRGARRRLAHRPRSLGDALSRFRARTYGSRSEKWGAGTTSQAGSS